jgi:hypothetical protein
MAPRARDAVGEAADAVGARPEARLAGGEAAAEVGAPGRPKFRSRKASEWDRSGIGEPRQPRQPNRRIEKLHELKALRIAARGALRDQDDRHPPISLIVLLGGPVSPKPDFFQAVRPDRRPR